MCCFLFLLGESVCDRGGEESEGGGERGGERVRGRNRSVVGFFCERRRRNKI